MGGFMQKVGLLVMVASFMVTVTVQLAFAKETVGENAQASAKNAKRGVKKFVNRTEEALCIEGDLKCTAEKAGHRVIEAKDATVDAAKKIKNKID
jgi:hypothetical protein